LRLFLKKKKFFNIHLASHHFHKKQAQGFASISAALEGEVAGQKVWVGKAICEKMLSWTILDASFESSWVVATQICLECS